MLLGNNPHMQIHDNSRLHSSLIAGRRTVGRQNNPFLACWRSNGQHIAADKPFSNRCLTILFTACISEAASLHGSL